MELHPLQVLVRDVEAVLVGGAKGTGAAGDAQKWLSQGADQLPALNRLGLPGMTPELKGEAQSLSDTLRASVDVLKSGGNFVNTTADEFARSKAFEGYVAADAFAAKLGISLEHGLSADTARAIGTNGNPKMALVPDEVAKIIMRDGDDVLPS